MNFIVILTLIDFGTCGGIGYCELLHRTNLLALVGGGQAPKFPESRVMIWDDLQSKFVYELNFKSKVLSIRMKKKRLISPGRSLVSTLHWVTVYLCCTLGHCVSMLYTGSLCIYVVHWVTVYLCCTLGHCVSMLYTGALCIYVVHWVTVYLCCTLGHCVSMLYTGSLCIYVVHWVTVYLCCTLGHCTVSHVLYTKFALVGIITLL